MGSETAALNTPIEVDAIIQEAKSLIEKFRSTHPQYIDKKVPFPLLLKEWEQENGPLIATSTPFTYVEHSYLVPIDSNTNEQFIQLARPEGLNTLIPMIPNPCLCPRAALSQMVAIPALKEVVKETTQLHLQPSNESDPLFSIDTVGNESVTVTDELKEALGRHHEVLKNKISENEEAVCAEYQAPLESELKEKSCMSNITVKDYLLKHAGKSISGIQAEREVKPIVGYMDLQTMNKSGSSLVDTKILNMSLVRELVQDNSLEPRNKNDKAYLKKMRKQTRENIKEEWYGMRRRTVTPEDKAEFMAIDLRGYVDGVNTYRGGKRRFELSTAESGFFQYGIVRDGGLEKPVGERISTVTNSNKKAKSLVKSLILKN